MFLAPPVGRSEANNIVSIVGIMCLQIGVNLARKWRRRSRRGVALLSYSKRNHGRLSHVFAAVEEWKDASTWNLLLSFGLRQQPAACEYKFITNSLRAARHLRGPERKKEDK